MKSDVKFINKYDKEIESKLNINDFIKSLKNTLLAKNEPIRVLKVKQIYAK